MFLVWWSLVIFNPNKLKTIVHSKQPSVLCISKRDTGQTQASWGCTLTITNKAKLRRVHAVHPHDLHQKPNFTVNNENQERFSSISLSLCLARGLQWLKTKKNFFWGKVDKLLKISWKELNANKFRAPSPDPQRHNHFSCVSTSLPTQTLQNGKLSCIPLSKQKVMTNTKARMTLKVLVTQLCLTLCDLCQAPLFMGFPRQEYWMVAIPFSRRSFRPRDPTQVSFIEGKSLPSEPPRKPGWRYFYYKYSLWVLSMSCPFSLLGPVINTPLASPQTGVSRLALLHAGEQTQVWFGDTLSLIWINVHQKTYYIYKYLVLRVKTLSKGFIFKGFHGLLKCKCV